MQAARSKLESLKHVISLMDQGPALEQLNCITSYLYGLLASSTTLHSANRRQLIVPRCRLIRPSGVFDCCSDGLELAA